MRFNLDIGAGDFRLADVTFFGRLANVSLWMGDSMQTLESRYQVQFDEGWMIKADMDKAHDAIRVAIAHSLENGFDPALINLLPEAESPRWAGRILGLVGPQQ